LVTFSDSIPIPGIAGLHETYPPQLVALSFAILGMIFGSFAPQWIANRCHILMDHIGLRPVEPLHHEDLEHSH
jgi:hypothetical protein